MIIALRHDIRKVMGEAKDISYIYKGAQLVWQMLNDTFSGGSWRNDLGWSNEAAWSNG